MPTDVFEVTVSVASVPTDLSTETMRLHGIGESGKRFLGAKSGNPTRGGVVIARAARSTLLVQSEHGVCTSTCRLGLCRSRGKDVTASSNC